MKRFVIAALTLCLTLCLCACGTSGGNTPTESGTAAPTTTGIAVPTTEAPVDDRVELSVRVTDKGSNPVAGLRIQLCDDGGNCLSPVVTDEDGYAIFKVKEDQADRAWGAQFTTPDQAELADYEAPEAKYPVDGTHTNIVLVKRERVIAYTVKVVDEGSNPVEGVKVQFWVGEETEAKYEYTTKATGDVSTNIMRAEYTVKLAELPAGYTADAESYTFGEIGEDDTCELTIVLKAVA